MKNNLRVLIAVTALTCGLGIGTASATLIQPVFSPSGNAIFGNDDVVTSTFSDVFTVTLPSDMASGGASVIGGFNLLGFDVFIDSFSLFDVTTATMVASGVPGPVSVFSFGPLNATDSYQLLVDGHMIGSNISGSYSGNLQISPVPEPETYAMMLAGLGLVGFSLFRRKGIGFSTASYA